MQHILITGGTGTLGTQLTSNLHKDNHVTVLSRDEKKLVELKHRFPSIRILVGDIRRPLKEREHMRYDTIFHCAALKHVDIGEQFPDEFFQTNYIGTKNVWELAEKVKSSRFIFFSTDKAVLPINAYGYSKGMAEKFMMSCGMPKIYRWGNIIGSRGSVIPTFVDCIMEARPCVVTDARMTRFWLTINEAINYVLRTYTEDLTYREGETENSNLYICPTIKAAKVVDVVRYLGELLDRPAKIVYGSIRPGEKIHECLRSGHDYCIRSDTCDQYLEGELKSKLRSFLIEYNP